MRDLTHPYLGLGSIPIKGGGVPAASARESAEMERIRAEILRLGAVTEPGPDWRAVVDCAVVLLRDQRKDLQVACYLCWGLFEREGYTGLAVGLTVIRDMVALYWDSLHPPTDRNKARLAALDWLAENLTTRLERTTPSTEDKAALERALAVFVDIEEAMRRHFGVKAPPFGHPRRQVAEHLGQLPGPKPAPESGATQAEETAPPQPFTPAATSSQPRRAEAAAPASESPDPASPPSRPRQAGRILTPMERAYRRARLLAVVAVTVSVVALAGGAGAYWYYDIKRIDDIAAAVSSTDAARRAQGLEALAALPARQRAALLRNRRAAILDRYIGLAAAAADRYDMVAADAFLETAFRLYPDSVRLAEAQAVQRRRGADIRADVAARRARLRTAVEDRFAAALSAADAEAAAHDLDRMLERITEGDVRNAREGLNALARRLPPEGRLIHRDIPNLAALAVIERAEAEAGRQRYTRALQLLTDGVVFLPDHPLLRTTRLRHATNRSVYLLRRTLDEPDTLTTLLVHEAADQMRREAPARFQALARDLVPVLAERLKALGEDDPARARALIAAAQALFPEQAGPWPAPQAS